MAVARLRCNLCEQALAPHCPDTNHTCTWLRCTSPNCTADVYDVHRGLLRHRDGHVEGWDQQPTTEQPPTITITGDDETDDGRTPTPDP